MLNQDENEEINEHSKDEQEQTNETTQSSEETEEICTSCKNASIGCAECKKRLSNKINSSLEGIREKRQSFSDDYIKDVIQEGSKKARLKAKVVLQGAEEKIMMYRG